MTCHLRSLVSTATTTAGSSVNPVDGPQRHKGCWSETEGALHVVPRKARNLVAYSQEEKLFLAGALLLELSNASLEDGIMQGT